MEVKALVPLHPSIDFGVLVGAVVVQDQMDLQPVGDLAVDGVEELDELGVAVPRQALADARVPVSTSRAANRVVVPLRL